MTEEMIIQTIASFTGSLAFSVLYGNRKRLVFPAGLGGLFIWVLYLLLNRTTAPVFVIFMTCSAFAALYAQILARIMKAPATCFFLPTVFSLIPGSHLFYSMYYLVRGMTSEAATEGTNTLIRVLAMACGISIIWAIFMMIEKITVTLNERKNGRKL